MLVVHGDVKPASVTIEIDGVGLRARQQRGPELVLRLSPDLPGESQ